MKKRKVPKMKMIKRIIMYIFIVSTLFLVCIEFYSNYASNRDKDMQALMFALMNYNGTVIEAEARNLASFCEYYKNSIDFNPKINANMLSIGNMHTQYLIDLDNTCIYKIKMESVMCAASSK